ncbi:hypothetical protein AAMO2058_001575500, partial [Amorphochlora amoebiformis]
YMLYLEVDMETWHQRVLLFTYRRFAAMRIGEMWEIILYFPDNTKPALEELRRCLAKTGEHHLLVQSLRDMFSRRLLTPGANTRDILLQYSYTIGALCVVDPTRIILKAVGPPICQYLRSRNDTVRCIVSSLIDPKHDKDSRDGLAELVDLNADGKVEQSHSDDEDGDDFAWEPDALLADGSKVRGSKQRSDILQMLMTIYGSNELFIKEYRVLLADLLLNKVDFETDKQVQQLELLKIRFGEAAMHACNVMLRDIAASKRVNSHIKTRLPKPNPPQHNSFNVKSPTFRTPRKITRGADRKHNHSQGKIPFRARKLRSDRKVKSGKATMQRESSTPAKGPSAEMAFEDMFMETTILSKEFWPSIKGGELKLPPTIQQLAQKYSELYTKLKAPRVLKLVPDLGRVHLEIELEDRTLDLQVSPSQATCLSLFQAANQLSLGEIGSRMGCDAETARRALAFWLQKKVLKEIKAEDGVLCYGPREKLTGNEDNSLSISLGAEDVGGDYNNVLQTQTQAELKVIESYIMGIVLNPKPVPLAHVKNMLKLMMSDDDMKLSDGQIADLLDRMTRKGKIECRDGRYKAKRR